MKMDSTLRYQLGLYYTALLTGNRTMADEYAALMKNPPDNLDKSAKTVWDAVPAEMRKDWRELCEGKRSTRLVWMPKIPK